MAEEKSTPHIPFKDFIPEEAREHLKAAHDEMRKSMELLLPPGLLEHRRAARREALKAARIMIDKALEKMEERDKQK